MGRLLKIRGINCCLQPSLFRIVSLFLMFSFSSLILIKVDDIANRMVIQEKTIAGHNLDPTPWQHHFRRKNYNEGSNTYTKALNLLKCNYLTCLFSHTTPLSPKHHLHNTLTAKCPSFYQWIHQDLNPWAGSKISQLQIMEARKHAAFRVVIVGGRMYVELYYACVETRMMFTIWGLLQLLKRYPGMVPDVDLMFNCMDRPLVERTRYKPRKRWPPPPLFCYCTDEWHFDIPFPDWSFWGWSETNIQPWDEEFRSIKRGSQTLSWTRKRDLAYWKGNPFVGSPVRKDLLRCNDSTKWGAEIFIQDWERDRKNGFKDSKLANQCKNRYKIYAEGFSWSVSLKYILSCGSLALIISPQYEDFFSRGLIPKENYWHVSRTDLCHSIKFAVQWGNTNPKEAEAIGRGGQDLMKNLNMENVYGYMYHLINEYSKLQTFKPTPPSSAQEVCEESVLCFAGSRLRQFLEMSRASPSLSTPCTLPTANHSLIEEWIQKKGKVISEVQEMEKSFAEANGTNKSQLV